MRWMRRTAAGSGEEVTPAGLTRGGDSSNERSNVPHAVVEPGDTGTLFGEAGVHEDGR